MKRYIDKLFNLIYNYKRKYMFLPVFAQKIAKYICIIATVGFTVFTLSSAAEYGVQSPQMSIYTEVSDGKIVLSVSSSELLCGFLGELEYDRDSFVFLGAEKSGNLGDEFCLSYVEKDGKIRFLLDGDRNVGRDGEIISFYFDYLGSDGEMFAFSVYPKDHAYYFADGELVSAKIEPFGVAVKCRARKNEEKVYPAVALTEAVVTDENKLRVFCASSGNYCFCGLKISVIDLESQAVESYQISSALPPFEDKPTLDSLRNFFFDIEIPRGEFTIIVTPAVCGRRETRGESLAYYFSNGELVEY